MSRKRHRVLVGLLVGILLAFGVPGTVLATHLMGEDTGTLAISVPWGSANQDPADPRRVVVTYRVKASGNIPLSAVTAVLDGIDAWNVAIDGREPMGPNTWAFDLVEFTSAGATASGAGSPLFAHNPNAPLGHGGGNGGGGGGGGGDDKPDIDVQLKKGGGVIAGQAMSSVDGDGFRVACSIKISGGSFGVPSAAPKVQEITMHEMGHCVGLGHHSNENDLLGRTVGHDDATSTPIDEISQCDLDGFERSHHWLTAHFGAGDPVDPVPHVEAVTSITCP